MTLTRYARPDRRRWHLRTETSRADRAELELAETRRELAAAVHARDVWRRTAVHFAALLEVTSGTTHPGLDMGDLWDLARDTAPTIQEPPPVLSAG